MGKKEDKKLGRFFIVLAIASAVITLLEGLFYYHPEEYANPLFRWMLIFQNTIKAFGFRSEIGLREIFKKFGEERGVFETAVDYTYTFAVFTAPYCTLAVVYKVLESLLRFRILPDWLFLKKHVIVFGYNEEVKILLKEKQKKYRIHLVAEGLSKEEEVQLLRKGIIVHQEDCLQLTDKQRNYSFKRMELKRAQAVILFEESASRNFLLYQMFHKSEFEKVLPGNVKFFARCEDEGIKWLMEEYYNSHRIQWNEQNGEQQPARELEIVSISELRIRKMLEEHPLHGFYLEDDRSLAWQEEKLQEKNNKKAPELPARELNDWKLHLLIVGFGKLGQQVLLQAMNMGVVSSENEILIDVVDFHIEEKKSIFANNFHEDYVDISEREMKIPSTRADGGLRVRFHQMDIRYKQFYELLSQNGGVENGGPYTYVAICVENIDLGLHCMLELKRYMQHCMDAELAKRVRIGIRAEGDRQMADYLRESQNGEATIFVMAEMEDVVSLEQLIEDNLIKEAKRFNYIYSVLTLQSKEEYENTRKERNTLSTVNLAGRSEWRKKWRKNQADEMAREEEKKCWSGMVMFKRNSNRAVAQHAQVRELWLGQFGYPELKQQLDEFGVIYQKENDVWTFAYSEEEMVRRQSDRNTYPLISEIARMEHRRWCYYMASLGWKRTEEPGGKKNETKAERKEREKRKENACLCNWDELVKYKSDVCKYDLMPLLMEYEEKEP